MILEEIISLHNAKKTFKILAFIILSLPAFQYGSQMQNILFSTYSPKFNCHYNSVGNNHSVSKDQCSVSSSGPTVKCNHWNFSSLPVGRTMVSDYNLVCDNQPLGDVTVVIWYCTYLAQPVVGWLSDRYGRKTIALLNLLIETGFSISLAFAPNIITNIILRIFIGISGAGLYVCYVWLLEMVNMEYRDFAGSFYYLYACIAEMVFPLTAHYSRDWRKTQLMSMLPSVLYVFVLILPESPRWLVVTKKKQEAVASLEHIAKFNDMVISIVPEDIMDEPDSEKESIFQAFSRPIFSSYLAITALAVFTTSYSSTIIIAKQDFFHKNIYLSIFIQGLMDLPSLFISYYTFVYFKRKTSFIILNATGTSFLLFTTLFNQEIPWQSTTKTVFGCIAKLSLMSSYQNILTYSSGIYPTTHRTFAVAAGQIVNMFAFVMALYTNRQHYIIYVILNVINFLIMCVSCILVFKFLPETKDLPYPETTTDQDHLIVGNEAQFLMYMKNKSMWDRQDNISETSNEKTNLLSVKDN